VVLRELAYKSSLHILTLLVRLIRVLVSQVVFHDSI
jgi:hypothetical protein